MAKLYAGQLYLSTFDSNGSFIKIWNKKMQSFKFYDEDLSGLSFDVAYGFLFVGDNDGDICVENLNTKEKHFICTSISEPINFLKFREDKLFLGTLSENLHIIDLLPSKAAIQKNEYNKKTTHEFIQDDCSIM